MYYRLFADPNAASFWQIRPFSAPSQNMSNTFSILTNVKKSSTLIFSLEGDAKKIGTLLKNTRRVRPLSRGILCSSALFWTHCSFLRILSYFLDHPVLLQQYTNINFFGYEKTELGAQKGKLRCMSQFDNKNTSAF